MGPTCIWRILLTGGQHGGKTTLLGNLASMLEARGFVVFRVGEAATEVIQMLGGVVHEVVGSESGRHAFQVSLTCNQLTREGGAERLAAFAADGLRKDVVVLFDRGVLDGAAFVPNESAWEAVLRELPRTVDAATGRAWGLAPFDCILHLRSSAGHGQYDACSPTTATKRLQTRAEAAYADARLGGVYDGLPGYTQIPYRDDFAAKEVHVGQAVCAVLGCDCE